MGFSFFGGIHPKENKHYAQEAPIQEFPEPDVLVIPLSQHIGTPCNPLVKKGDRVLVGQKLGDNEGLCVPVHSSVSGTVKGVEMKAHTNGMTMMSVVIENDHLKQWDTSVQPRSRDTVAAMSIQELMDIIREAGIVGMGGATFPTHVKLASGANKVNTLIINASECEPYIVADDRLCRECSGEIISGIQILMRILGLQTAVIAMEDNKPEAAKILKRTLNPKGGISLELLPTKYPHGAEKQLIYAITGRQVPSGGLPVDVRCAVVNIATCKAIHDAVYEGKPLTHRVVTVSGDIVMAPKNLLVPIGTSFNDLMEAVGVRENPYKVLSGGPMMGVTQYDLSVPVVKGTNAVTFLGRKNRYTVSHAQCIRCGKCIEVCPMQLMPLTMYQAAFSGNTQEMRDSNLMDCIECGCCAYSCPACVPLVLAFRSGKHHLRSEKKK